MKIYKHVAAAALPLIFAVGCETTPETQAKIDQAISTANDAKAAANKASAAAQAAANAANRAAAEAKAAGDKADRIFQKNLRK